METFTASLGCLYWYFTACWWKGFSSYPVWNSLVTIYEFFLLSSSHIQLWRDWLHLLLTGTGKAAVRCAWSHLIFRLNKPQVLSFCCHDKCSTPCPSWWPLPLNSLHGNEGLCELLMFSNRKNQIIWCTCRSSVHWLWGKKSTQLQLYRGLYWGCKRKCDIYTYVRFLSVHALYPKKYRIDQYWFQRWYNMNFHLLYFFLLLEICHFVHLNRHTTVSYFPAMDLFDLPKPIQL